MGKRITIGLLFSYNENWIGGTYYMLNLIQSLLLLEDELKPKLVILLEKESDQQLIADINYPYVDYRLVNKKISLIGRIINKLNQKTVIKPFHDDIDIIFPADSSRFSWIKNKLFWIPDFQELHLPHFFPGYNLDERKKNRELFSQSKQNVLFSSQDALQDYNHFFSGNNTKNFVLNFSVFHPNFDDLDHKILQKYNLNEPYFFAPNQFWKHKNQLIILQALFHLKNEKKLTFKMAFSGKEYDNRNENYIDEVKQFVKDHQLEDYVEFLGFIDRKEQLYLMKNAIAIVQPSLFEGWSTVVEDVKRLNQNCIVSNIKVHIEQLGEKGFYFDPSDHKKLSELLFQFATNNFEKPNFQYDEKAKLFGVDFLKIIKSLLN